MFGIGKKQVPLKYDEQRHEIVEVVGDDDQGATFHQYIREKGKPARIIGEIDYERVVRPIDRKGQRR